MTSNAYAGFFCILAQMLILTQIHSHGSWNNLTGLVNATSTLTDTWQRFGNNSTCSSNTANAIILQFNASETAQGANDYFEITGVLI